MNPTGQGPERPSRPDALSLSSTEPLSRSESETFLFRYAEPLHRLLNLIELEPQHEDKVEEVYEILAQIQARLERSVWREYIIRGRQFFDDVRARQTIEALQQFEKMLYKSALKSPYELYRTALKMTELVKNPPCSLPRDLLLWLKLAHSDIGILSERRPEVHMRYFAMPDEELVKPKDIVFALAVQKDLFDPLEGPVPASLNYWQIWKNTNALNPEIDSPMGGLLGIEVPPGTSFCPQQGKCAIIGRMLLQGNMQFSCDNAIVCYYMGLTLKRIPFWHGADLEMCKDTLREVSNIDTLRRRVRLLYTAKDVVPEWRDIINDYRQFKGLTALQDFTKQNLEEVWQELEKNDWMCLEPSLRTYMSFARSWSSTTDDPVRQKFLQILSSVLPSSASKFDFHDVPPIGGKIMSLAVRFANNKLTFVQRRLFINSLACLSERYFLAIRERCGTYEGTWRADALTRLTAALSMRDAELESIEAYIQDTLMDWSNVAYFDNRLPLRHRESENTYPGDVSGMSNMISVFIRRIILLATFDAGCTMRMMDMLRMSQFPMIEFLDRNDLSRLVDHMVNIPAP